MFSFFRTAVRLFTTVRNWPVYLLRRFGFIRTETIAYSLKNKHLLHVRTRSSDTNVFNDVWLGGVYDIHGFDWNRVKTVVDVGAHIGVFTLYALTHAPQAKVYALEPEPTNLDLLRKNIIDNRFDHLVTVEPLGLAGNVGTLALNVMPGRGECNSLYRQTEQSYRIVVKTTTLQELFDRYEIQQCDLLKMNCEGAEYEIFYSLPDSYYTRINAMIINYHFYSSNPRHHPHVLQAYLESKGFTVTKNAKNIFVALRA